MFIQIGDVTILNIDKMISMLILTEPKIEKIKTSDGFFGFFPSYSTQETPYYKLELKYKCGVTKGQNMTFYSSSADYQTLKKMAQGIILQIRQYDSTFINAAFEEAFLKDN